MTLEEFIKKTGVQSAYICKKCGITRQTLSRIKQGVVVNKETADKIRWFTNGAVDLPHSERHTSNRIKAT